MADNNGTLKTVAGIAGIGTVFYFDYQYYKRKESEETIKAQTSIIKSDSVNAANTVSPLVEQVKKLIALNPKSKTYTDTEYKNFASSLYEYFKTKNFAGLISIFEKLKTNTDLILVTIYYSVKVFKTDNFYNSFEIKTYNLSQSINNLTTDSFKTQLTTLLKSKNITYNLF